MSRPATLSERLPRTLLILAATCIFGTTSHVLAGGPLPALPVVVCAVGLLILPHDLLARSPRSLFVVGAHAAACQVALHTWFAGSSHAHPPSTASTSPTQTVCPHHGHCLQLPVAAPLHQHEHTMVAFHALAAAVVAVAFAYCSRLVNAVRQATYSLFALITVVMPFDAVGSVVPSYRSSAVTAWHPRLQPARGPPAHSA